MGASDSRTRNGAALEENAGDDSRCLGDGTRPMMRTVVTGAFSIFVQAEEKYPRPKGCVYGKRADIGGSSERKTNGMGGLPHDDPNRGCPSEYAVDEEGTPLSGELVQIAKAQRTRYEMQATGGLMGTQRESLGRVITTSPTDRNRGQPVEGGCVEGCPTREWQVGPSADIYLLEKFPRLGSHRDAYREKTQFPL